MKTLSIFSCVEIDDTKFYLAEEQDVACYSKAHNIQVIFLGVPSLAFWAIGVPAFFFFTLLKKKNILFDKWTIYEYGFIYNGFKEKYWYWEFTQTLSKLIFILVYKMIVDYNLLYKTLIA